MCRQHQENLFIPMSVPKLNDVERSCQERNAHAFVTAQGG
jgi:hypothetical protein